MLFGPDAADKQLRRAASMADAPSQTRLSPAVTVSDNPFRVASRATTKTTTTTRSTKYKPGLSPVSKAVLVDLRVVANKSKSNGSRGAIASTKAALRQAPAKTSRPPDRMPHLKLRVDSSSARANESQVGTVNASRDWVVTGDGKSEMPPDDRTGVGPTKATPRPTGTNDDGDVKSGDEIPIPSALRHSHWWKRRRRRWPNSFQSCQYTTGPHTPDAVNSTKMRGEQRERRMTALAAGWNKNRQYATGPDPTPTARTPTTPPKPGVDPGCRFGTADTFLTSSTGEWPSLKEDDRPALDGHTGGRGFVYEMSPSTQECELLAEK
ncbi:hypothetical protein DFP72DRAFT_1039325 [Ephemerocybe angulata]|uniref:Uncharacterized protein n=1 Tax=Ephemerocybe angulata TaxID=980116 RepID=A0A8H6IJ53_9AGAR|nr:hypothetical protein DFP72DRAFT_1039325 [Tulosesus angulatus]